MASQRYAGKSEEYDNEFELERDRYHHSDRNDRRGSQSRLRRHQNHDSRSRSRSIERRRRRRNSSHSRSRSRSRGYGGRRYSVRRHRDSRSRSRSRSRSGSHKQRSRRYSRSSSPSHDRHSARRNNHRNKESSYDAAPAQSVSYPHAAIGPTSATGLENFPLPAPSRREAIGAYYNLDTEEPIDKARIHREMEEKLRQALAREGKVYPPPKPEASHPVFANDGSFLEIFKKMQQQTGPSASGTSVPMASAIATAVAAAPSQATPTAAVIKSAPPPPPLVGRRRGGKILKTGLVAKPKIQTEGNADPKDFWALYLAEVNKYKNNACESDGGTRPLVK